MKRTISYAESHVTEGARDIANVTMAAGILFPPLFFLGLAGRVVTEGVGRSEASDAVALRAESETEADEAAEAWARNRNEDETSLRIEVSSGEGRVIYTYEAESD